MGAFLEYSNKTHSNIIPQDEFEELTQEVFGVIASNLSKSLGPMGSSATILDGMMTEATKDGYSILKKYVFHNRYKKMIYNLIKAPCTKLNNTVGDATTTVICLANAIFNRYKSQQAYIDTLFRLPRHFTQAWQEVIDALTDYAKLQAVDLDTSDWDTIYNIAYVVSNGNAEISKNIADTYKAVGTPAIKQKNSPTNKSYISAINGFDFPANLISDEFAKNDERTINEKDLMILIMDHKLEPDVFDKVVVPIVEVCRAQSRRLLVLAPYFDAQMCETKVGQYISMERMRYGASSLLMAQFELGKLDPHQMTDAAIIMKCKALNQEMVKLLQECFAEDGVDAAIDRIFNDDTYKARRVLGEVSEAMLSCTNGSILKNPGIEEDEQYKDALRHAKSDLEAILAKIDYEQQSYASKVYEAQTRINQLEMKNFIYYVGADSALQQRITWDSIEDTIKCVRSAVKSGIVPGCQLTLMHGCNELIGKYTGGETDPEKLTKIIDELPDEKKLRLEIINIINSALKDVYAMVLHGADGMGMIKLMPRWQYTTEDGVEALQKEAKAKAREIIEESVKRNQVFDMETLEYSDKIITSAETDTMALSAASDLVKILISGNQCIFLDADVNESHQETMEVYG